MAFNNSLKPAHYKTGILLCWQCLEELSIQLFNPGADIDWIKYYPCVLMIIE
ncbi:hypothetical protein B738_12659 [Photorhabdus temperata subsp. temperata M1021]|nr:hypothetical protein B738_12659 [Photorhabdus temperata subsp. temperata M1021]